MSRDRIVRFGTPPRFSSRRLQDLRCSAADAPTATPERSNPHQCHPERDDLQAHPLPRKRVRSLAKGRRPAPVPGAAPLRRCPAVRAAYVRFRAASAASPSAADMGGQLAWKAVPDPVIKVRKGTLDRPCPPNATLALASACHHGHALVEEVIGGKALPDEMLDQILAKTMACPCSSRNCPRRCSSPACSPNLGATTRSPARSCRLRFRRLARLYHLAPLRSPL